MTSEVNPTEGGDIRIQAGGNIIGIEGVTDTLALGGADSAGLPSGVSNSPGSFLGQFWGPWLLSDPKNPGVAWYVNFGSFDQGVMSIGGNVSISAGGDIHDLAVSTPTTGYIDSANALHVTGGGDLSVTAEGSIYSGDFYVGRGAGSIRAGGAIAPDFSFTDSTGSYPVPTLLALQYGAIDVEARQSADIGGVFDPTYIGSSPVSSYQSFYDTAPVRYGPYFTTMGPDSGVSIQSTAGELTFNSLLAEQGIFNLGRPSGSGAATVISLLLPASLNLAALDGGIDIQHGGGLYPSASGSLTIVADQSVDLAIPMLSEQGPYGGTTYQLPAFTGDISGTSLGKLDETVGDGILPTATDPEQGDISQLAPAQVRDPALAQDDATASVLIYSLTGSVADGEVSGYPAGGGAGATTGQISLIPNAPAQIYAAQDILDLPFYGENFNANDISSIIAGRDIRYNILGNGQPAAIELAGPGTLQVEAGRDFDLQTQRIAGSPQSGIRTLGNAVDANADPLGLPLGLSVQKANPAAYDYGNPNLPDGGASVSVLFGVGPGIDQGAFIHDYIDPAGAQATPSGQEALLAFMAQYDAAAGEPQNAPQTAGQAWAAFQTLPANRQQQLVEQVFIDILNQTGIDYNDPDSPAYHSYAAGYQAINTLFPAASGYTANNLTGGSNGANQLVSTGDFDMRGSTLQTQQGGNIDVFGPGGRILVGSSVASPATNPSSEGILTLESGNIATFTDTDVLVAQSRVMTEQGGGILMWSSNGNLDAGKGAKTSVSAPPPLYACDITFYCTVDIKGVVSGAGIATLQSLPGVPAGDANLIAPRGTVDAGAAGIRVSGNLNITALQVLNAANVDVAGKAVGLPAPATVNIGALTAASQAASGAVQAAEQISRQAQRNQPSIISVEILGYGDEGLATSTAGVSASASPRSSGDRAANAVNYDPASPVQLVGVGQDVVSDPTVQLTDEERHRLQSN